MIPISVARFERVQSQYSRQCEWEDRIRPLRPYLSDIRDGVLCLAFMVAVCAILWR